MGRIGTLVCVVVVAATAVTAAGSASAQAPEYGRCLKLMGGKFRNAGCTTASGPGEEKYEWYPGFSGEKPLIKTGFTERATGTPEMPIQFEGSGGVKVKVVCKALTGTGSYTGTGSLALPDVVLSGCESGGSACTSMGRSVGEVVLDSLRGALGVIKKGETPVKDKIGVDLSPQTGTEIAQFSCALTAVTWRGSVILPVKSNAMTLSTTLKINSPSRCLVERFEGGERDVLEGSIAGGPFERWGCAATLVQTDEEKIEIKVV
ncbi:MAG: hypothetical protein E6G62_08115 [Actinobacteria bacterium]|nr:MAG: hypothetical protein E6G62_08115 [Actinomycetota bacterium]